MDALVVGAGAIGQVYGYHLAEGGADVRYLVKPEHLEATRAGFVLHHVEGRRRRQSFDFVPEQVVTSPGPAEQVWLCVPTQAVTRELVGSIGEAAPNATMVFLQPSLAARRIVRAGIPDDRLVMGAIGLLAYPTPLRRSDGSIDGPEERGVAFHFPPGTTSRFQGPDETTREIVATLRAGGCPARTDGHAERFLLESSAVLVPHVAALEQAGWSLASFRHDRPLRKLAARASRQGLEAVAAELSVHTPWFRPLVRASLAGLGTWLAPHTVPFDLERYLEVHFGGKVHAQTGALMGEYVEAAASHGLERDALEALRPQS